MTDIDTVAIKPYRHDLAILDFAAMEDPGFPKITAVASQSSGDDGVRAERFV